MVREFLGVFPGDANDVKRSGLKIKWLVDNFGTCELLDPAAVSYRAQITFHIRAHLLRVIGSNG